MQIDFITQLCDLLAKCIPADSMQLGFMQHALLGLLLLTPMTSICGTQVVNFNMAFFSDAIGHSAFAGVAFGLLLAVSPDWTMPLLALAVGLGIMAVKRRSALSTDTVIGVFFSAVVAAGLAVVSRYPSAARDSKVFLYGDILTIGDCDILAIGILLVVFCIFEFFAFNRLICIGLNQQLAKAHGVGLGIIEYLFAALLSLVVIFSVKAVGVLLVTALLITPAAAARNLAESYGAMLWWSLGIGMAAAIAGLFLSTLECVGFSTGATIVLCSCAVFAVSMFFRKRRRA